MSNIEEYQAYKVDNHRWDEFARQSSTFSIFATSSFLNSTGSNWSAWIVESKTVPILGATLQVPSDIGITYQMYNGILQTKHLESNYLVIRNAFICLLEKILETSPQNTIVFSLHHDLIDIRPFQWWADYSSSSLVIRTKYSAVIDYLQSSNFEDYRTAFSRRRRRDYLRAIKAKLRVSKSNDISVLINLHESTLRRHGVNHSLSDRKLVQHLSKEVLNKRLGELLISRSEFGESLSAILWIHDHKTGYVLFWANHNKALKCGSSTFLVFELIQRCRELGLERLDLGGMNSFGRSVFKDSLGAVPVQFKEISINNRT